MGNIVWKFQVSTMKIVNMHAFEVCALSHNHDSALT